VAFITVPLLVTTVIAVRYIRRKNRERRQLSDPELPSIELDTSVVGATIVLTSLPTTVMERTLDSLPGEMTRAILMVRGELPPIAQTTIQREQQRWLSHFSPPRSNLQGLESEEAGRLAAATIRLILEDSA